MAGVHRLSSLQMLLLPSSRGKPDHIGHFRPLTLRVGSAQAVPADILEAFRRDVLRKFQKETHRGKGPGFSLEEVVVGGVGDQGGLAILFDAHFL